MQKELIIWIGLGNLSDIINQLKAINSYNYHYCNFAYINPNHYHTQRELIFWRALGNLSDIIEQT